MYSFVFLELIGGTVPRVPQVSTHLKFSLNRICLTAASYFGRFCQREFFASFLPPDGLGFFIQTTNFLSQILNAIFFGYFSSDLAP